jgi:glutamate dehydrogenase/leucine dehydrogenase
MDSPFSYNALGVAFIADDVSKNTADKVNEKMEEIMDKALEEFEKFLESQGLEFAMGVVIPKQLSK